MKKILSIVLLLALCLGLFAGCQEPAETTSDLANAKALLFSKYKPASKDEIPTKSADFEVMTSVLVDGVSYPVEWSVAVTSGAADAVKIVDGSSAAFKKVDLTEKPETEIQFTLTAVIKDAKGNSETLTFKYITPAFQAPTADKVVILNVKDQKYATGVEYEYTSSSSGKTKMELSLTDNKAEALAYTMINNADGTVTFKTDCGKYLFCDANSVELVAEESDYTKFVLEVADGGYYIKCAVANYNGNPQYLEVYSGYLTCYGLNSSSNVDLYIFALEDATGANGTVQEHTPSVKPEEPEDPEKPEDPEVPSDEPEFIKNPEVGTAYKFGFYQANVKKYLYFTGKMSGNFFAMSANAAEAVDVYLETAEGGYYFYFMDGETKTYLSLEGYEKDGKQKAAVKLTTEATTVFTYSEELKIYISTIGTETFMLGTYGTFETISASSTYYISGDKAGDLGVTQFVADFCKVTVTETPDTPEKPEEPAGPEFVKNPEVGTAYKFGFYQANVKKYLYFTGKMSGNFFAMSANAAEAVDVYLETAEGGYYFYFMDGETKTYLSLEGYEKDGKQKASVKLTTEATTVFTYSEELKIYISTIGTETFMLGTYGTFETISASSTYYISGDKAADLGVTQFVADFCKVTVTETPDTPEKPEEPETPVEPETPAECPLVAGKAYKIKGKNANGDLWFKGTQTGGRFDASANEADAVLVYVEAVEGGYLLYMMDGETKTYITMADNSKGAGFTTDAAAATVFEWNADLATLMVAEDSNSRAFGSDATKTYTNFSSYDTINNASKYDWVDFVEA